MKMIKLWFMVVIIGYHINGYALLPKVTLHTLKIEKELSVNDLKNVVEYEAEVSNPLEKDINITLKLLHPQYSKPVKSEEISLEPYILGKDKIYKLKAKESKKIKIGLKLPENMRGSKYIYYGFDQVDTKPDKAYVAIELITYGQMTINIKDTFERKVELENIIEQNKNTLVVRSNIKNIGNTYIRRIEGQCVIHDSDNNFIGKFPLSAKEGSYLFQTNNRTYSTLINKKLKKGKYKFTFLFTNTDGNFNKVEQSFFEVK